MHRVAGFVCGLWMLFVAVGLWLNHLKSPEPEPGDNVQALNVALVTEDNVLDTEKLSHQPSAGDENVMPLSIEGYRDWNRVNEEPFVASPKMTAMCFMTPSMLQDCAEDPQFEFTEASPPTGTGLRQDDWTATLIVFVNDLGKQAMLQKESPEFPVGSIIVKEKWKSLDDDAPQLMTVMRKREFGYNLECGDWEFAGFEGDGTLVEQGRLENCTRCHTERPNTDYVFRSYLFGDDVWITRD